MPLSAELAQDLISKMKTAEEFKRFTSFKKSRNYIVCSTVESEFIDVP
jgi:hypothetical protein